jgi:hypothetical protein
MIEVHRIFERKQEIGQSKAKSFNISMLIQDTFCTCMTTGLGLWYSWMLLVEKTGIPAKNHWHATSNWQTLSHNNVVSSTPHHQLVSNGDDCIGSCKSNYHSHDQEGPCDIWQ